MKEWEKTLKEMSKWNPACIGGHRDKIGVLYLAFVDDLAIITAGCTKKILRAVQLIVRKELYYYYLFLFMMALTLAIWSNDTFATNINLTMPLGLLISSLYLLREIILFCSRPIGSRTLPQSRNRNYGA